MTARATSGSSALNHFVTVPASGGDVVLHVRRAERVAEEARWRVQRAGEDGPLGRDACQTMPSTPTIEAVEATVTCLTEGLLLAEFQLRGLHA